MRGDVVKQHVDDVGVGDDAKCGGGKLAGFSSNFAQNFIAGGAGGFDAATA